MTCPTCGGTGVLPDDKVIGDQCRKHREVHGIGLRNAAKKLGISHTYLSQLENGQRRWTKRLRTKIKDL